MSRPNPSGPLLPGLGKRGLVVGRRPEFVRRVRAALASTGYEAVVVSGGREARESLAVAKPEWILLDVLREPGASRSGYSTAGWRPQRSGR